MEVANYAYSVFIVNNIIILKNCRRPLKMSSLHNMSSLYDVPGVESSGSWMREPSGDKSGPILMVYQIKDLKP